MSSTVSRQKTIVCEECDCVIDDARSIVGINDISGCTEPFSSVFWTFYGYERRILGYRRHDACCNATLRVTYYPIEGLPSEITSEYATSSSKRKFQSTTTSSYSTRQTSTSTRSQTTSTRTSRPTSSHIQSTTSTHRSIVRVTPRSSSGITFDRNVLYYGLAGVLSLILLVLFISFLLWLKKIRKQKQMTLKEEESSSDSERTPSKPTGQLNISFEVNEPVQSEYSMIDAGDGNGYFLIEKQTDKIVDIKLDKTTSTISLADSNLAPEGAYYLLEGILQPTITTDKNLDEYMEIPYQEKDVSKNQDNDIEDCEQSRNESVEDKDFPIYSSLNNEQSSLKDDACVYNSMTDFNDDYDSLWSCQDKKDDVGNYGLFSFSEIDKIMETP